MMDKGSIVLPRRTGMRTPPSIAIARKSDTAALQGSYMNPAREPCIYERHQNYPREVPLGSPIQEN